MLSWSTSFLMRFLDFGGNVTPFGLAGLVVASLNLLFQVFLSACFGEKSVLKLGGKR